MDHGEEVGGELVVTGGDPAEVLQLGEEPLGQVPLAVEPLAEAGFPLMVALGRDVRRGTLGSSRGAAGVISLGRQHNGERGKMIEQPVGHLAVMGLSYRQGEPDRGPCASTTT